MLERRWCEELHFTLFILSWVSKDYRGGGGGGDVIAGCEQDRHTRFWRYRIPVAFGFDTERSDSAGKLVVRRAPFCPLLTQLDVEGC